MSCRICEIIKQKKNILFEDEYIISFLDDTPATPGHVVVTSKKHFQIIEQVPDNIIEDLFFHANKISIVVFETLKVHGTNMIINNGIEGQQTDPHFSINIVPRKEGDGLNLEWTTKQLSPNELSDIALKIESFSRKIGTEEPKKLEPVVVEDIPVSEKPEPTDNYLIKQLRRIP